MIRLFETHIVRKQVELEGLWEFTPIQDESILPTSYVVPFLLS